MTTLMIAVVSFGLSAAEAAEEGADQVRFQAERGSLSIDITDWFVPTPPPEMYAVKERVCRALFTYAAGKVDVETRSCAAEVARDVRDVGEGWQIDVSGVSGDQRLELFEAWFVYPGRTGPDTVRVFVRQAHDVAWVLPDGVDPLYYTVDSRVPIGFPVAAVGRDTRDASCRAHVEVSSTGLPSDVWVEDCDDVYRDYAEEALRRWRFEPPVLDGAPFRTGVTLGVDFKRVIEGPSAPGVSIVRFPEPPDLQGRPMPDTKVDYARLNWVAPELPRDTPLFGVRTDPYAEVLVYQLALPEALTSDEEISCPVLLGVNSERRQQVFHDEACPKDARAPVAEALKSWLLASGDAAGARYARMPLTFVFPGSGQPYARIAASQVTRAPGEEGWPVGVVAQSALKPMTRVAPKLPKSTRDADPEPGRCVVKVEVSAQGRPTEAEVVSCPEVYVAPSLKAIRRWRWAAAEVDGEAVAATTTVSLRYN